MGRPNDARLTAAIAQEVCVRTGSAAVLEGSITTLGSQYVLGLSAKNCTTGSLLDQEQIQVPRREDVLNSLSLIARKFRARVGESLAMVEHHSTPLEEATTASLEALKAYSIGMRLHFNGGSGVGIPFLRRAVEIDPQFAMAYANLSLAYWDVGKSLLSAQCAARAWQLRNRTSERERYFIDFLYDRDVTGNLEKAYQTLESWYRVYPHGAEPPTPRDLLGGISTNGTGRYARAIEIGQKTIADLPDVAFGYGGLAVSCFLTDSASSLSAIPSVPRVPRRCRGRDPCSPLPFHGSFGQVEVVLSLSSQASCKSEGDPGSVLISRLVAFDEHPRFPNADKNSSFVRITRDSPRAVTGP
jgi:hypothetical protein